MTKINTNCHEALSDIFLKIVIINVAAAMKLAKKLGKGKTVLPDTAERYFSTPLFG